MAVIAGDIHEVARLNLPGELREREVGLEGIRDVALERGELGAQRRRQETRPAAEADDLVSILIVVLPGTKEMHPVLDDRTTDRGTSLPARVVGLGEPGSRRAGAAVRELVADVRGHETLVLVLGEPVAVEVVFPGLRDRGDDGARGFFVLSFEVLRDDAELLDRVLRERIAPAGVLADDAAVQHVVLVARAVDEDVRIEAGDGARENLFIVLVGCRAHARRKVCEVQKVAVVLRKLSELLLGDVGRDLARLRLDVGGLRRDGHGLTGLGGQLQLEVDPQRLAEHDDNFPHHRSKARQGCRDRVRPRLQGHVVEPRGLRRRRQLDAALVVDGLDQDARQYASGLVLDRAAHRAGRGLRARRGRQQRRA